MPVYVSCSNPSCARSLNVSESALGQTLRCPACGTSFVATADSGARRRGVEGPARISRFEVRERLGAGAFGAVFRAYDPQLDREVALKVPHAAALDSPKRVERFLREAKAAARLRHPHIVPVYDAGRDGERYFIASAYVEGRPLAEAVTDFAGASRRVAQVVRELADALAYAHGQGIIHRDVKPANVMLDRQGHVHLMDFGLATWGEESSKLTNDGAVLGTPSYMAPEQAAGKLAEVGSAADQYSLGVVLYELLTGQTPFAGPPATVLYHVLHTEPAPPRRHRPDVPADLDTICRKATAKRPADRYPDCRALADDLRRWLEGEPIWGRRVGPAERLLRWARRNPALAFALTAAVASLLLGTVVALTLAGWALAERGRAKTHAADAAAKETQAQEERGRAQAEEQKARAAQRESKLVSGRLALDRGIMLCEQGNVDAGLHWFVRSLELLPEDAADLRRAARQNLANWRLTVGAVRYMVPKLNLVDLACLGDGRLFTRGWGLGTRMWDAKTGAPLGPWLWAADARFAMACSPDGRRALLMAQERGTALRLWDTEANQPVGEPWVHDGGLWSAAFSPDGTTVITCDSTGKVVVWDVALGKRRGEAKPLGGPAHTIRFHPDGKRVALITHVSVVLWDVETRQRTGPDIPGYSVAEFTPDGRHLLCFGSAGTLQAWDIAAARFVGPGLKNGSTSRFAVRRDGAQVLTVDHSTTVRLWQAEAGVPTGRPDGPPWPHAAGVVAAAYSADGATLVTATGRLGERILRARDLPAQRPSRLLFRTSQPARSLACSPDSDLVIVSDGEQRAEVWSAQQSRRLTELKDDKPGRWLFLEDGTVAHRGPEVLQRYNARTGKPLGKRFGHADVSGWRQIAISPDGKTLLAATHQWRVRRYNAESGELLSPEVGPGAAARSLAFTPDGQGFLVATGDGVTQPFASATGQPLAPALRQDLPFDDLAFRPGGREFLGVTIDLRVTAWSVRDGDRIEPLGVKLQHVGAGVGFRFSRDGTLLLSRNAEGGWRFWDVEAGRPISSTWGRLDDTALSVTPRPDGRALLTGHQDGSVRVWELAAPAEGSPERLRLWVEVLTGTEMDAAGVVTPLEPQGWEARKKRLADRGGPSAP